jgi:NAD(P)-dependent dehydrogenase (short-subunit alcohol dehydrogenase family)
VNNAGTYDGLDPTVRAIVDDHDRTMAINVRDAWLLVEHLAYYMPRDGSIIKVTSGLGHGTSSGCFSYSLAK